VLLSGVIATAKILKADRVDGRDDGVRGRANYRHSAGPQIDDVDLGYRRS